VKFGNVWRWPWLTPGAGHGRHFWQIMSELLQEKILNGVEQLSEANRQLAKACRELGEAEHAYRQARSTHYLKAALQTDENGKKLTEPHRGAIVDKATDTIMYRVRIAEGEKEAALQLVLSLRTQISAVQSLLRRDIEEAAAVRYGQGVGA